MPAKAGEISRETGTYCCKSCRHAVSVRNGTPIPNCPACGDGNFQTGGRNLQNEPAISGRFPFAIVP